MKIFPKAIFLLFSFTCSRLEKRAFVILDSDKKYAKESSNKETYLFSSTGEQNPPCGY